MQSQDKQVLVIEDDQQAIDKICGIISDIPNITIIKAEESGEAYQYALEYTIDLFIVDIMLNSRVSGDVSGIQFAETIRSIEKYSFTPIIFTTALEDPKLHAYSHIHCYGYFEKPYDITEFKDSVTEALKYKTNKIDREYFYFKNDGIIYPIKVDDIVYIENKITRVLLHCVEGDILSSPYKPLGKILLELNSNRFFKCNRYIIINRDYVENIDSVNRYIKLKSSYGNLEIGQRLLKSVLENFKQ